MKQIAKVIELSKQSHAGLANKTNEVVLADDPKSKQQLASALSMFFDTMKLYGKEPDQLESVTRMFMWALGEYPYDKIQEALKFYAKNYSEMPAPADIVTIIERGNKPAFERSVYVSISKKPFQDRTYEERQYMNDYEYFQMHGDY